MTKKLALVLTLLGGSADGFYEWVRKSRSGGSGS
jgi:hypothetical protein